MRLEYVVPHDARVEAGRHENNRHVVVLRLVCGDGCELRLEMWQEKAAEIEAVLARTTKVRT